jgi:hypothetical protein
MKLRSRIFVGLCFAFALAFPAIADITYTQGSGTTIFDFTCFTTKHCSAHVPINSAGTEIGTSSAEVFVGGRGTAGSAAGGVLTVQGVASMTPLFMQSATAPVSTMNSASANSGVTSPAAAVFDDTSPTAITENSFGFLRMSANRNLYGTIRDAAGNERGANVNASNELTVSVGSGSVFNANGRAVSASSSPVVPSAAPTTWHLISAATTNATSVKGSAATLFSCQLGNIDSTAVYLKIYNKATSPTVGSDTPVKTLIIPKAGTAADGAGSNVSFGPGGLALGTGFAAAITAGITVADTTAVSASKVVINCDYE